MEELSRQKAGKSKHADDVRETLQWLDEATTKHPDVVTLQGADETYERWAEVERFAVPRTLFSENDHEVEAESEPDQVAEETAAKLDISTADPQASVSSGASDMSGSLSPSSSRSVRSSASPVSPPTSPAKAAATLPSRTAPSVTAYGSRPTSSSASVPLPLQPLFNYILWRIHQETDPVAALESFIFLCNDPRKVNFAKGFDIKTKRLEQLREAVGREDRDHKNRHAMLNRENQNTAKDAEKPPKDVEEDTEVVFKPQPPKAPAAMLQKQKSNVIDPNAFERGPQPRPTSVTDLPNGTPKSPRAQNINAQRGSPRGGHALPFAPRGAMRGVPRGGFRGNQRGRGAPNSGRGGFTQNHASGNGPNGQIDPDSFTRPDPRGAFNGSRGGRKLWVPT